LWDLGNLKLARYLGSVSRTITIGQNALGRITLGSCIGILINAASNLVRSVFTIGLVIAEEQLVNALTVTTLQLAAWTNRFVGLKVGTHIAWLSQLVTIVHLSSPIAGLSFKVKNKSCGTSDSCQCVTTSEIIFYTPHSISAVGFR